MTADRIIQGPKGDTGPAGSSDAKRKALIFG